MNFETIAYKYLKNCRIKVSYNFFYQKMVSHPDYPALSALAETLDELGILYNAVIFEEKGNPNITFPFLAHSPQKEGGFEIISSKKHYQKIKSAFFKKMGWDGYNGKSSSGHKK